MADNYYMGRFQEYEEAIKECRRHLVRSQVEHYKARADSLVKQQKENMLSNSVPVLQEQVRSLQQRIIELEGNVTYEEV